MKIIWNKTSSDRGAFVIDDGSTVLVTIALPLNGRVFGRAFRGDAVGL